MTKYAIIVAGGKGLRMGANLPKQFIPIAGKPILMHTLERFVHADSTIQIILVLPQSQQAYWKSLCEKYQFEVHHLIADGGETRFHSVNNGLKLTHNWEEAIIGVHDGVRPFVSNEVINRCYRLAEVHQAVVPAIDVVETLRHLTDETHSVTVPRSEYKLIQTPQVFSGDTLIQAYSQPYQNYFTDDASVAEAYGTNITLTTGNRENIKITTPFDLTIAEALLQKCSI